MKLLTAIVLSLILLITPSCAAWSPARQASAIQTIEREYDAGVITATQRDALIEAVKQYSTGLDWQQILALGLSTLLGALGGGGLVRVQRGPATQKVGLPSDMIIPVA